MSMLMGAARQVPELLIRGLVCFCGMAARPMTKFFFTYLGTGAFWKNTMSHASLMTSPHISLIRWITLSPVSHPT